MMVHSVRRLTRVESGNVALQFVQCRRGCLKDLPAHSILRLLRFHSVPVHGIRFHDPRLGTAELHSRQRSDDGHTCNNQISFCQQCYPPESIYEADPGDSFELASSFDELGVILMQIAANRSTIKCRTRGLLRPVRWNARSVW